MPVRKPFVIALGVALISFTAANLWFAGSSSTGSGVSDIAESSPAAGEARIGGRYILTDQNGKQVDSENFKGKLQLVFFGFTHCPDICPVGMMTMTGALEALKEKSAQVTPVFITVDPKRDTPEAMKEYIRNFHPSFVGLTGTPEQIKQAVDAYKVYMGGRSDGASHPAARGAEADYSVDHSGFIYLMDRNGKYLTHFNSNDSDAKLVDGIMPYLQ